VARRASPRGALTTGLAGLYGPGSEAWRLNREATMLLGAGPRALLLQIAHPLVAEGVDQHSDFRADPWRRLEGTLRSYLAIVYGTTARAEAEIARLERIHRRVTGPVLDPRAAARFPGRYEARDPSLSLWVHATLVDSTIVAYREWIEPLGRDAEARYYAETLPIGRAFGIPEEQLPQDLEAFEAYVARMLGPDGPVHPTPTAQQLAAYILHPTLAPLAPPIAPFLDGLPRALYDWAMWPAVALLPPTTREEYGIAWGPVRASVAAGLLAGFRFWRPLLPPGFRQSRVPRDAAGCRVMPPGAA
jgi:uncharacterized protein (DUF2236 family)